MIVYCVEVYVKAGHESEFITATKSNHIETRRESGNIRFDLSQSADTEGLFFLYEVYKNDSAVLAHKETSHYLKWREKVEPLMEKKRYGRMFKPVFPADEQNW